MIFQTRQAGKCSHRFLANASKCVLWNRFWCSDNAPILYRLSRPCWFYDGQRTATTGSSPEGRKRIDHSPAASRSPANAIASCRLACANPGFMRSAFRELSSASRNRPAASSACARLLWQFASVGNLAMLACWIASASSRLPMSCRMAPSNCQPSG